MKHIVPLIVVGVHRDITTTLYPHVPEHEIPVLQSIHGDSNIYPGEPSGESTNLDADGEYDRLCAKYGDAAVRDAYGASAKGDIRRLVVNNATGTVEDDNTGIVLEGPDSNPKGAAKKAARSASADDGPSAQWSKAQLIEHAEVNGVDVDPAATKAVILAAIEAAAKP